MQFDLSTRELDLLYALLDAQVGKKLVEIRRTDTRNFREDLKAEEEVLEGLLRRLKEARTAA
jgi:hypothetical protein